MKLKCKAAVAALEVLVQWLVSQLLSLLVSLQQMSQNSILKCRSKATMQASYLPFSVYFVLPSEL